MPKILYDLLLLLVIGIFVYHIPMEEALKRICLVIVGVMTLLTLLGVVHIF